VAQLNRINTAMLCGHPVVDTIRPCPS